MYKGLDTKIKRGKYNMEHNFKANDKTECEILVSVYLKVQRKPRQCAKIKCGHYNIKHNKL